jgi:PAS domain S-box-containing protein
MNLNHPLEREAAAEASEGSRHQNGGSLLGALSLDDPGVGALFALALAFGPNLATPVLVRTPPAVPGEGGLERRLRKAETRYQTLVEKIPVVTFMVSFENQLSEVYVSPQVESMLGYTATEWVENPILWYERLHPDDRARWNEEFSRTVSYAESFKSDHRFLAKDGRVVWIHGEVTVERDDLGTPSYMQGIGYDVTELKHAEEIQRRSRHL